MNGQIKFPPTGDWDLREGVLQDSGPPAKEKVSGIFANTQLYGASETGG
jgi:hypothetical protein